MQSRRITELDGIRGVAILMVLVWHYFHNLAKTHEPHASHSFFESISQHCWSGVDLFFVLSGYLIGGIILQYHGSPSFLKVFWIRRACRILPAFLILMLVTILLAQTRLGVNSWLFESLHPWWCYLTFTQNFPMGQSGIGGHSLGITWSLAVEEQFYLVAPIAFLLLGREKFVKIILPLIIGAGLLRVAYPGPHTNVVSIFRADALLAGFGLAALFENPRVAGVLQEKRRCVALGFAITLAVTFFVGNSDFGIRGNPKYSLYAFLYAFLLLTVLLYRDTNVTVLLRRSALVFFGKISYSLYLYHQLILGLTHELWRGEAPTLDNSVAVAATALAFGISVLLAWLSTRFAEDKVLQYGRSHRY